MSGRTPSVNLSRAEGYQLAVTTLRAFYAAWRAAAVYDENNTAFRTRREELAQALRALFASGSDCTITYQNDYIFFNGERLNYDREFSFGRSLAARFADLRLGGVTINSDAPPGQIDQALFALATADRRVSDPFAALEETWNAVGLTRITIQPLAAKDPSDFLDPRKLDPEADPNTIKRRRAQALFQRSEAVVQEFWERVRDRNSFDASTVQRVVHLMIDEVAHDEDVLMEFAALKEFDEYTYYHSVNVALYSIAVGMRLGMDRIRLAHLGFAALFHDVGKVKLPRELIAKPEEFDDDDWEQIRRHPTLGALTLASLRAIEREVGLSMAGAFEHHLKMDLTGYPRLTRPRALHLFSRIISICDAYDAMTSGRIYQKETISPDEAVRRLLYKGREWYDPLVLKAFVNVIGVFPVGTVVRLSDGKVAMVMRNDSADLYAPEVLVVREADGTPTRRAKQLRARKKDAAPDGLHITDTLDAATEGIALEDYLGVIYQPDVSGGIMIPSIDPTASGA